MPTLTLEALRRHAVSRSLFKPTTLPRAIAKLGFVQADPIRAPARAQDLTLRHRVIGYRAGELERRYPRLAVEEDAFVNYGFLAREHLALMHPRTPRRAWDADTQKRAADVLAFVRERGAVHPREVDAHFLHGNVRNYWGGSSSASTHLLDGMHYRGLLRVVRRDAGIRVYEVHQHPPAVGSPADRAEALLRLVIDKYAPLPAPSLGKLTSMLQYGAPQLAAELRAVFVRMKHESAGGVVDGVRWFWPEGERPASSRHAPEDVVRLLAPFDPVVWDRLRFELFWGWAYRFEAYVPAPKRERGYYALPLLWRDRIVGWGNAAVQAGTLAVEVGYIGGRAPRERAFNGALEAELRRMSEFLGMENNG